MKHLLISVGLLLGVTALVQAGPPWVSSNTATADTAQPLCRQTGQTRRGVLHGVCVNDNPGGQISIYNSSSTAVNPVAVIRSTAAYANGGCYFYDVYMSTGITYSKTGIDNVTFMYECY